MRTYTSPTLMTVGDIVELTRGSFHLFDDPDMVSSINPFGSVGFSL